MCAMSFAYTCRCDLQGWITNTGCCVEICEKYISSICLILTNKMMSGYPQIAHVIVLISYSLTVKV